MGVFIDLEHGFRRQVARRVARVQYSQGKSTKSSKSVVYHSRHASAQSVPRARYRPAASAALGPSPESLPCLLPVHTFFVAKSTQAWLHCYYSNHVRYTNWIPKTKKSISTLIPPCVWHRSGDDFLSVCGGTPGIRPLCGPWSTTPITVQTNEKCTGTTQVHQRMHVLLSRPAIGLMSSTEPSFHYVSALKRNFTKTSSVSFANASCYSRDVT